MNLSKIRESSLQRASSLGYETNASLPLLDSCVSLRSKEDIICRSLALFSVVACSYGFNKSSAQIWVKNEGLKNHLTASENLFIYKNEGLDIVFQRKVECLQAFAWVLSFVDQLDFDALCDKNLITIFPDIKKSCSSEEYKRESVIRTVDEIVSACDLSYCLHWATSNSIIKGQRHFKLPPYVIEERRRVLEWVLYPDNWDEISLDT